MKLLLDMNLSPRLCHSLTASGFEAVHWSDIGHPKAADHEIMGYAHQHGYVVLSHDLDYSAMLAASNASKPSVVQIRFQDVLSERYQALLIEALNNHRAALASGSLLVLEETRMRIRLLPLRK